MALCGEEAEPEAVAGRRSWWLSWQVGPRTEGVCSRPRGWLGEVEEGAQGEGPLAKLEEGRIRSCL